MHGEAWRSLVGQRSKSLNGNALQRVARFISSSMHRVDKPLSRQHTEQLLYSIAICPHATLSEVEHRFLLAGNEHTVNIHRKVNMVAVVKPDSWVPSWWPRGAPNPAIVVGVALVALVSLAVVDLSSSVNRIGGVLESRRLLGSPPTDISSALSVHSAAFTISAFAAVYCTAVLHYSTAA